MRRFALILIAVLLLGTPPALGSALCSDIFTLAERDIPSSSAKTFHDAFRDLSKEQAAQVLYGASGEAILRRLTQLSPLFDVFIFDPGVILRLGKFEDFVRRKNLSTVSPSVARKLFSDSLGSRTLYRALALTPFAHNSILKHGLESQLAQKVKSSDRDQRQDTIALQLQRQVTTGLRERVNPVEGNLDPYMSFTEIPEIAIGVARAFADRRRQVYLYRVEVPILDTLYLKGSGPQLFRHGNVAKNFVLTVKSRDGQTIVSLNFYDQKVETFVFYKISPQDILEWKLVSPEEYPIFEM